MKTTVEISDNLFAEARQLAKRENRSLRALIEEGLRLVVGSRRAERGRFEMRKASFVGGEGLAPDLAPGNWEQIRQRIYESRGE